MKQQIEKAIKAVVGDVRFAVERPSSMEHGDYSTNVALVNKLDANDLASKLTIDGVAEVKVVGKFINFYLSREALIPKEQEISQTQSGKTVLVEYTSPNLFKPLHIGNLIGNILGESVARLTEQSGAKVLRLNYPSDIGLTVAKGVWGLQKLGLDPADIVQLGRAYVAGNTAYEDGSAKTEIEEINKALYEDTNPEWSELRKKGIETSRKHLDDICAQLGTVFNKEFFESESGPLGRDIVREHIGKVFEESEGAVVYKGEQDGLHTRVFLNSKGLPTYEAKEVGLFDLKSKAYPNFDASITVTGNEQKDFFAVVFAALRKVYPHRTEGKTLKHISNGFLRLTTGKMSSRLGNVITGESLIADLVEVAKEKMQGRELKDVEKTAEMIAVGAIKYAVLKQGSGRDIIFDPEKSLSLEGDSGPYLQYSLVRARSVLEKVRPEFVMPAIPEKEFWMTLAKVLVHYPEVVERATKEMEPHYVTTYLTELASAFNSLYGVQQFIVDGKILGIYLKLVKAFESTMSHGLNVLGIPAPEEM